MFNQMTSTFYDANEHAIHNIVTSRPLQYITNTDASFKRFEKQYNVNIDTTMRQQPTRLNEYYREYQSTQNFPYEILKVKEVNDESKLIKPPKINEKHRYETDLQNPINNFFKIKTNSNFNVTVPKSSRNLYKNNYVCAKKQ